MVRCCSTGCRRLTDGRSNCHDGRSSTPTVSCSSSAMQDFFARLKSNGGETLAGDLARGVNRHAGPLQDTESENRGATHSHDRVHARLPTRHTHQDRSRFSRRLKASTPTSRLEEPNELISGCEQTRAY